MSSQEATSTEFYCKVQSCKSKLKTSKTFENHMRTKHPNVHIGETSSAPVSPPSPTAPSTPITDSPPLPEQTIDEMYNDGDWVRAVVEEMELMQEMVELTENEMDNEKTKDQVVNDLKEKLERFKTIAEKKSSVVKSLKAVKERLVYDINMRKEVESRKEAKIDELEKLVEDGKKIVLSTIAEARNKKDSVKDIQKEKAKLKKSFEELTEEHNNLAKEKNNIEIDLQTKTFLLKEKIALLVKNGIQEDEVVVVEETSQESPNNSMKKSLSGTLCLICDRKFVSEHDLENHMAAKHEKNVKCPSCKRNFSKDALKRHTDKSKCSPKHVTFVCSDCKMECDDYEDLKQHKIYDHEDNRSSQVCSHYRKGNCRRANCPYAHVGHQDLIQVSSNSTPKSTSVKTCRNGDDCVFKARGKCHFYHGGVGVQTPLPVPPVARRAPPAPRFIPQAHRAPRFVHQAPQAPRFAPQTPRAAPQAPRFAPQVHGAAQDPQQRWKDPDPLICARGPSCINLARGNCSFGGVYYHVANQTTTNQTQVQEEPVHHDRLCWFNENCKRIACTFTHLSLLDFPNLERPVRPQILRRNQQNVRFNQ